LTEELPTRPRTASRWPAALFGAIVGGLVAAAIIFAAAYNKRDQVRAWLLTDEETRMTAAEAKLADLSNRLDHVDQQVTQSAKEPPDTVKLDAEIAELRRSIPAEGLILHLTERIDALTQAQAAGQALLLTVGQLRDAVDRGDRFSAELAAARRLAQGDENTLLDAFADGAASGIPRRDQLLRDFQPLSETLLQKEASVEGTGLWQTIVAHLRKLISLRRMDGKGNDAEAVLGRTEAAFKEGDWDKAVEDMRALPGPFEAIADDWIKGARLRLAADRALSQLAASAAARTTPRQN
jgi:hypothetical protein